MEQTAKLFSIKISQSGGRNLLGGTAHMGLDGETTDLVLANDSSSSLYEPEYGTFSYDDRLYYMEWLNIAKSSSTAYIDLISTNKIQLCLQGEYYTISFWAKATTSSSISVYFYTGGSHAQLSHIGWTGMSDDYDVSNPTKTYDGAQPITVGTTWKRYYVTYYVNSTVTNKRAVVIRAWRQTTADPDIGIAGVKLARSSMMEDWDDKMEDTLLATGIDITNRKIVATADTFVIRNNSGTTTFSIDSSGNLVSSGSASFSGKITATSGSIAGWTINNGSITRDTGISIFGKCIIFNDTNRQAIIGTWETLGVQLLGRFYDTAQDGEDKYGIVITTSGGSVNRSLQLGGGYLSGIRLYALYCTSSTTLVRSDGYNMVIINSSAAITITLPKMNYEDDGYILIVRNLVNQTITVAASTGYRDYTNSTSKSNYITYGSGYGTSVTLGGYNTAIFVYHRALVVNSTYYGGWVATKLVGGW